jgi:membrane fusion protein (multidrug efflux system)
MRTLAIIAGITLVLFSCKPDKQAQLKMLKKQHDKIAGKIELLEKEIITTTDSSKIESGTFVAVQEIKYAPFNHYIEVQGKLDGDQNIALYPEAMGAIEEVYAKVGDRVSKGQVMARLNDAAAADQLRALVTNYNLVSEVFEKQKRLWEQEIGSEVQFLQAKANKESLEAQIAGVKKQLDMMRIKSPINGTVEESSVKVGQTASPQFPAFRVVNFSTLKVTAEVAEAYASKINVGDEVIVYLPDINQEKTARINFNSKYINPVNRTYQVEARLNPGMQDLKANMVAILKIRDYGVKNAVSVPVNMLQSDHVGNFVLIAEKHSNKYTAEKLVVKTGQIYNGIAEIVEGLKPGQIMITSGYLDLKPGEEIRF